MNNWNNAKQKTEKLDATKDNIFHLTCITFYSSPSRFTQGTHSVLYVTRVVSTVGRTGDVTVTTEDTGIFTTCIIQISDTRWKSEKFNIFNISEIYWEGTADACDPRSYLLLSMYQLIAKTTLKCFLLLHKLIAAEF